MDIVRGLGLGFLFVGSFLVYSVVKAADPAVPTITIPADLRARYWRSQAELTAAQARLDSANASARESVAAMTRICTDAKLGPLTLDPAGEPTCGPAPNPTAKPEVKPEPKPSVPSPK